MAHDVFICHSSKDRTIANAICSTLEQNHIRCWIAPRDVLPGSDYGGAIIEAISSTRITVLVFSSNSNDSPHVRREIERTISHGIPVLPFRVEEITPSKALEYFISDAHWLDAMTPPLEQHLDHLVGTVRLLLEREAARGAGASEASAAADSATAPVASAPEPAAAAAPAPAAPATAAPASALAASAPTASAATSPAAPATLARRMPSTPVLAALGGAALVVLAGGAFLLGGGGGRPGASQIALASATPAPSVNQGPTSSPGVTPGSAASEEPSIAPGSAAAQLAAALPASLSCDPPETASSDSVELASVFCYVGDGTVGSLVYTLYPNLAALRNDYGSWLDYYGLAMGTSGSCADGDQMEDAWTFKSTPSLTEGHYFCIVDDAQQANLYWTDEASLILVDLGGDTGVTLGQLYPIWTANTYDPVRP
jgi:hypothetical protein